MISWIILHFHYGGIGLSSVVSDYCTAIYRIYFLVLDVKNIGPIRVWGTFHKIRPGLGQFPEKFFGVLFKYFVNFGPFFGPF